MKKYIGTKLVRASKAYRIGGKIYDNEHDEIKKVVLAEGEQAEKGYKVTYADGYESFSPADVFERAYLPIECDEQTALSVTQKMVDDFIVDITTDTMGQKTTIVKAKLANGLELVESSSCVMPENYDEELGREICVKKIKEQVWYLLGFLLQTAIFGIKGKLSNPEPEKDAETEKAAELIAMIHMELAGGVLKGEIKGDLLKCISILVDALKDTIRNTSKDEGFQKTIKEAACDRIME